MKNGLAYRKSWDLLRGEIANLMQNPRMNPEIWVWHIQGIIRNVERFPRNTRWPKITFVLEAFGHIPAKEFSTSYFSQVYHHADVAEHGGKDKSQRILSVLAFKDLKKRSELKRDIAAQAESKRYPKIKHRQLSLFETKKPS